MKVLENYTVRKEIIDALTKRKRSFEDKYLVSDLVGCPRKAYYKLCGEYEVLTEETTLTFARGKAHHSVLQVYPVKEEKIKKDDIRGDIDMIGRRITEIYTTTVSLKKVKEPKDVEVVFSLKVSQLMAYCHMKGKTEGDLLVFYLFGNYSRPIKPDLRVYTLIFEEVELVKNWQKLLIRKEEIEFALREGIPPFMVGEEWECENCGYRYTCLGEEVSDEYEDVVNDIKRELEK